MISYNEFLNEAENLNPGIAKKDFNIIREEYVDFWELLRQKIGIMKKYNLRDEDEVEKYNTKMRASNNNVESSIDVGGPKDGGTKIININRKDTYAKNAKDKKAVDDLMGKLDFKEQEEKKVAQKKVAQKQPL